jgi:hypothetical protein
LHGALCTEVGSGKTAPTPETNFYVGREMKGIYKSSEKGTAARDFENKVRRRNYQHAKRCFDVSTIAKINAKKTH